MTPNEFVVTYELEFNDGSLEVCELFRGSKAECFRIRNHSGDGYCDQKRVTRTRVVAGPAEEWEKFMDDISAEADPL